LALVGSGYADDKAECKAFFFNEKDINTLAFGTFAGTSETEGRLFVGKNAHLNTYTVGSGLPVASDRDDLVVGEELTFSKGTIKSGNVVYGSGNLTVPQRYNIDLVKRDAMRYDFGSAAMYFKDLSQHISHFPVTGKVGHSTDGGVNKLILKTNGTKNPEVFSVHCNKLADSNEIHIDEKRTDVTILVNVLGTKSCGINGPLRTPNSEMVLVNFPEAIQVDLTGSEFEASLLAPECDVSVAGGFIDGQSVIKSWSGAAKQKENPFAGCVPEAIPAADVEAVNSETTMVKTVLSNDGSSTTTTTTVVKEVTKKKAAAPVPETSEDSKTEELQKKVDELEAKINKQAEEVGVNAAATKSKAKEGEIVWDINADEPAVSVCKARLHVVAPGETLTSIANTYMTSVTSILPANPQLRNINELSIGDNIVIPCADDPFVCLERLYVIKHGDTLSQIAHLNGVELNDILEANPYLHDADHIMVDAKITLPCPDAAVFAELAQGILTSLLSEKVTITTKAKDMSAKNVLAPTSA